MKKSLFTLALFVFCCTHYALARTGGEEQLRTTKTEERQSPAHELASPRITLLKSEAIGSGVFRNYYEFEVFTSCGTVVYKYDTCFQCSQQELYFMAMQIGMDVNLDSCGTTNVDFVNINMVAPPDGPIG